MPALENFKVTSLSTFNAPVLPQNTVLCDQVFAAGFRSTKDWSKLEAAVDRMISEGKLNADDVVLLRHLRTLRRLGEQIEIVRSDAYREYRWFSHSS